MLTPASISKTTILTPKEDRIIVKCMHTPIIDEETFNIVQDMINTPTKLFHQTLLKYTKPPDIIKTNQQKRRKKC